jgi:hypothetical protein
MAGVARIPRSRGGVTGVLLILLGAWGGLAPFVGPYFHFGYTPDTAWHYNSGHLYLSIVPGAAALVGGLLAVAAGHRAVGSLGAVLAVLGGAWFIFGWQVMPLVVKNGSISPGKPLTGSLGSLGSGTRVFIEQAGFFTGTGALIVFLGALALGRFAVVGVRDVALAEAAAQEQAQEESEPGGAFGQPTAEESFPSVPGTFCSSSSTGQFPATGSQYSATEPGRAAPGRTAPEQYPTSTNPFQRPSSGPGPLRGPS